MARVTDRRTLEQQSSLAAISFSVIDLYQHNASGLFRFAEALVRDREMAQDALAFDRVERSLRCLYRLTHAVARKFKMARRGSIG
jgi:hypothetical protein